MRYKVLFLFLLFQNVFAQQDFSTNWEDLFSYNNVKGLVVNNGISYAITENAAFTYNSTNEVIKKISSINGLQGLPTSSVDFQAETGSLFIGYENGSIDVIKENGDISFIPGVSTEEGGVNKAIKSFHFSQNKVFAVGDFGIMIIDAELLVILDSSFEKLGLVFNDITSRNNTLFAATTTGIYSYPLDQKILRLDDINNWSAVLLNINANKVFLRGEDVLFTSGSNIYNVTDQSTSLYNFNSTILEAKVYGDKLNVTGTNKVHLINLNDFSVEQEVSVADVSSHNINTISSAVILDNQILLGTSEYGVLTSTIADQQNLSTQGQFNEIHPEGPRASNPDRINVNDNKRLITYGGYKVLTSYDASGIRGKNVDYYDGEWKNLDFGGNNSLDRDLTSAILVSNKILVSTYINGVLEFEGLSFSKEWDYTASSNIIARHAEVANGNVSWITDLITDNNNQIWCSSARPNEQKFFSKYDIDRGEWVESIEFPDLVFNEGGRKSYGRGVNKMFVDENNNVYVGTHHNGVLVFNADDVGPLENRRINILNDNVGLPLSGNAGIVNVISIAVDEGTAWIGTDNGLYVLKGYIDIFSPRSNVERLVFRNGNENEELLAGAIINDIIIDGAGNKWFATENAGVFNTSADGLITLNEFNTSNSPLPSNDVLDLELDEKTGDIYMVTASGIVMLKGGGGLTAASFGEKITQVVAFPNPAIKNQFGHHQITIVGKDEGLPENTNIKILDASGKLVYETNTIPSQQSGGKVVWDKTNLRGEEVASGIYIVLVSSPDGTEQTSTKIAIVN